MYIVILGILKYYFITALLRYGIMYLFKYLIAMTILHVSLFVTMS